MYRKSFEKDLEVISVFYFLFFIRLDKEEISVSQIKKIITFEYPENVPDTRVLKNGS